jgi:hypothetical protein
LVLGIFIIISLYFHHLTAWIKIKGSITVINLMMLLQVKPSLTTHNDGSKSTRKGEKIIIIAAAAAM